MADAEETVKVIEVKTHRIEGAETDLNSRLHLVAVDEPGPGGAYHDYRIAVKDADGELTWNSWLKFQKGPVNEEGSEKGLSNEVLLAVVRHRLECFQAGPFACDSNAVALRGVCDAMEALASRTRDRLARGVEGKNQL